ncbi:hypothetical protein PoB_002676000 [Plakobranchus ocellatus]|uniref:Uncharacterized protein n=1 Tax=Plakobranchus ocellatus TaxID=259542 RepID=A0AAV4A001_9GAST|nr:hypothetical protein PoB_002676000 [Plakobranchus ocellatus]
MAQVMMPCCKMATTVATSLDHHLARKHAFQVKKRRWHCTRCAVTLSGLQAREHCCGEQAAAQQRHRQTRSRQLQQEDSPAAPDMTEGPALEDEGSTENGEAEHHTMLTAPDDYQREEREISASPETVTVPPAIKERGERNTIEDNNSFDSADQETGRSH